MVRVVSGTALVTGASSGIGLAVARALMFDGYEVLGLSRTRPPIREGGFIWIRGDVADRSTGQALGALLDGQSLDALVHCVGTQEPVGAFEDADADAWEQAVCVNLLGAARVVRAALPALTRGHDARVLLLAGGGAFNPRPQFSAYATSKAGVVSLMETLADELAGRVAVNCVSPGCVPTPIHAPLAAAGLAVPEDDGGAALRRAVDCIRHLLGPEAKGLTGKSVSAVHDDWRSIRADMAPAINDSAVWTRTRVSAREGVTVS